MYYNILRVEFKFLKRRCTAWRHITTVEARETISHAQSLVWPRLHQVWTLERSEMRNIFARACVSGLTHSHAYEWKSMEPKMCSVTAPSDVTPTDRWLNVWCIWHTYLETLQECRSRHRIGWIIQDFRETCVSRSLMFHLETKMPWCQTPSRKKKAIEFTNVTTSAYQDQLNAGFPKVCEIFKVCGIESLKYVWEFHTPVCYCGDISTPETWRWTKQTVIGCLTCQLNGLMGGPWPINAAIYSRPSAVSLKVWLHETSVGVTGCGGWKYINKRTCRKVQKT